MIAYYIIKRHEPDRELGANYFDAARPEATTKRLVTRLKQLGYEVELQPSASPSII